MPTHRLLADEQFPDRATQRLRLCGHDVRRVRDFSEDKRGDGATDEEVVAIAVSERRAITTFNRKDFKAIHDTTQDHFGIIACFREDADPDALGRRIDEVIKAIDDLKGQYVRVPKKVASHHLKQQERARKRRGESGQK